MIGYLLETGCRTTNQQQLARRQANEKPRYKKEKPINLHGNDAPKSAVLNQISQPAIGIQLISDT
jgi:hypothetical protein